MGKMRQGEHEEAARCEVLEYASGALPGAERARIERHLAECDACRAVLVAYARLADPESPEEAELLDEVEALLDERELPRPTPLPRSRGGLGALALALAVIGAGVALRAWRGGTAREKQR